MYIFYQYIMSFRYLPWRQG